MHVVCLAGLAWSHADPHRYMMLTIFISWPLSSLAIKYFVFANVVVLLSFFIISPFVEQYQKASMHFFLLSIYGSNKFKLVQMGGICHWISKINATRCWVFHLRFTLRAQVWEALQCSGYRRMGVLRIGIWDGKCAISIL